MADEGTGTLWSETSERAILGHFLSEPEAFPRLRIQLKESAFNNDLRRDIYRMMVQACGQETAGFDFSVLYAMLETIQNNDRRIELQAELMACTQLIPMPGTVTAHIDLLHRLAYRRQVVRLAETIGRLAYDDGSREEEIEPAIYRELAALSYAVGDKPILDPAYRVETGLEALALRQQGKGSDVTSGYSRLDKALGGGFVKGTSTTVTAVTGGFKTTFGLAMARRQARAGCRVLVVSLEMPEEMLFLKDISALSGVDLDALRTEGGLDEPQWQAVKDAAGKLHGHTYYTWPYSGNVDAIYAVAQDMRNSIGLDVVILDYLQIADQAHAKQSRYEHVSYVSRIMTKLAKDLNIAVVNLAQMNRSVYGTATMMPSLSLLKESGSIENDSTNVLGLYFPFGVAAHPGKYVPDANKEWSQDDWEMAGAVHTPVIDEERGDGCMPSVFELQVLMLKARYGTADRVVRLGLMPQRNEIFDPYGEPDWAGAELPSIQRPKQIEQYHYDLSKAYLVQAGEYGPGLFDEAGGPSLVAGTVNALESQRVVNIPAVSAEDMV